MAKAWRFGRTENAAPMASGAAVGIGRAGSRRAAWEGSSFPMARGFCCVGAAHAPEIARVVPCACQKQEMDLPKPSSVLAAENISNSVSPCEPLVKAHLQAAQTHIARKSDRQTQESVAARCVGRLSGGALKEEVPGGLRSGFKARCSPAASARRRCSTQQCERGGPWRESEGGAISASAASMPHRSSAHN